MPLQKQTFPISFSSGLDTKTDEKQVVPGKLLELENGVFTNLGQINKRYGYDILGTAIQTGSANITSAQAISTTSFDNELLLFDGSNIYSQVPSSGEWSNRGTAMSITTNDHLIIRTDTYQQNNPDFNYTSGVEVYAWEDSRGGVRYSVVDATSRAFLVADVLLDGNASRPRVVVHQGMIVVFYVVSNALRYITINPLSPTSLGSSTILASNLNTSNNCIDASVIGNRCFVSYFTSDGNIVSQYLDASFTASAPATVAIGTPANKFCITNFGDASQNVWIGVSDGYGIKACVFNYSNTLITSLTTLETISNIKTLTGVANLSSGATFYYEIGASATYNEYVRTSTMQLSGSIGTPSTFKRSVGLAAKAFTYSNKTFIPCAFQSTLQSTYFIIKSTGEIVGKMLYGIAGGLRTNNQLSETVQITSGIVQLANSVKGKIISQSNTIFSNLGVNTTVLDFTSANKFLSANLANNTLVVGGVLQSYDGVSFTEHGFHIYPEGFTGDHTIPVLGASVVGSSTTAEKFTISWSAANRLAPGAYWTFQSAAGTNYAAWIKLDGSGSAPSLSGSWTYYQITLTSSMTGTDIQNAVTSALSGITDVTVIGSGSVNTFTNTANGSVSAPAFYCGPNAIGGGNFEYIVTYEWTDNYGQIQRSTTSVPLAVSTFASSMNVLLTIPTLRLTAKTSPRSEVRIVIYRTQNNGALFYRVTSSSSPLLNDPTVDTVQFLDGLADASITANELVYTTGNVLDNVAPPSCSIITTYKDRVFIAGLEDNNTMWFSKQINDLTSTTTIPVEFSSELTLSVDTRGGKITALFQLDDNLIIFKETALFKIAGDGPTATGDLNDYGDPVLITSDVGCDNPNSVVMMPNGLMFHTSKGIYMLDRSLQVRYIGAPVQAFNSYTITSATLVQDDNQVRFTTSSGPCLVYDYYYDQWSSFTNHEAVDSDVYQGKFVFVKANGQVFVQNKSSFTDGGSPISMKLTTSWLSLAGLQNYQRVYQMLILGTYKSPHSLTINVAYDFSDIYTQSVQLNASNILNPDVYGGSSPYGSDSVYGGNAIVYQFRHFFNRQKCETVKISLQDSLAAPYGEGFAISGINLLVGVKEGANKMPASNSVG